MLPWIITRQQGRKSCSSGSCQSAKWKSCMTLAKEDSRKRFMQPTKFLEHIFRCLGNQKTDESWLVPRDSPGLENQKIIWKKSKNIKANPGFPTGTCVKSSPPVLSETSGLWWFGLSKQKKKPPRYVVFFTWAKICRNNEKPRSSYRSI